METSSVPTPAKEPTAISSIKLATNQRDLVLIDDEDDRGASVPIQSTRVTDLQDDEMEAETDANDPYAYLGERAKALRRERELAAAKSPDERKEEPVIELFMDSHLPDSRNLLVKVRYSQKFKEVREAFCKHNDLAGEAVKDVILTWKGLRVYDGSSCKDLSSIELTSRGMPIMKLTSGREESAQRIVLVATTREIDAQEKADAWREKQAALEAALEAEARGGAELVVEKEKLYRIVLRSKGYDDYKLRVKASTEIEKIIGAFRRFSNSDKSLSIQFDGEELGPEMQIGDTEVAEAEQPMMLEVYEK